MKQSLSAQMHFAYDYLSPNRVINIYIGIFSELPIQRSSKSHQTVCLCVCRAGVIFHLFLGWICKLSVVFAEKRPWCKTRFINKEMAGIHTYSSVTGYTYVVCVALTHGTFVPVSAVTALELITWQLQRYFLKIAKFNPRESRRSLIVTDGAQSPLHLQ